MKHNQKASSEKFSIAVIGAGSWGTAVAALLSASGHDVKLWARDSKIAERINKSHQNDEYLPKIKLPSELRATCQLSDLKDRSLFLMAVPSFAMRPITAQLKMELGQSVNGKIWISLTKGAEYERVGEGLHMMSNVISAELGADKIFALSGPSFAAEVASGMPTTVVLAGRDQQLGKSIQSALSTGHFRVYLSDDLIGVELGGTFKNVIALAAGISDGLGFGDNAKGALISRGLVEMTRLGTHLGARKETFFGLAGLGDMVISAMSNQSRNHAVGFRIGRGESLDQITKSMGMVAEGVFAVKAFNNFASDQSLDLPITRGVYETLYEDANPLDKLTELMAREPKREEI